uniref:Uncharacterized protein n=1 Tax=Moniliophthora roreri TaxID=221103 RepID=A0A0W0GBL5_MONRR
MCSVLVYLFKKFEAGAFISMAAKIIRETYLIQITIHPPSACSSTSPTCSPTPPTHSPTSPTCSPTCSSTPLAQCLDQLWPQHLLSPFPDLSVIDPQILNATPPPGCISITNPNLGPADDVTGN